MKALRAEYGLTGDDKKSDGVAMGEAQQSEAVDERTRVCVADPGQGLVGGEGVLVQ